MAFFSRLMALVGIMALIGNNLAHAQSIKMAYCASINTSPSSGTSNIYQSDGRCHDQCVDKYALAVIKDDLCWCSDYVPDESTQVDTSECNQPCPGFPSDVCGGDGLWGYIALTKNPAGTTGGSTSTFTPTSTKTSSPDATTSSTVEHSTSPTPTSTPPASVATVTVGGTVSLVTVFPTNTASADSDTSSDANSSGVTTSHQGLSTAQAVGVAVGVLGAVAIAIAAGVFFCLRRRRRQQRDAIVESPGSHRGSSAGMMSTPTTGMASVWDADNTSSGRRNSRLMPHDPRMDPYATNIYSRFDNKSHESVNTLQDNQDYSRKVLRTTNPDPVDIE
ncbi:hypothetical protein GGR54DRAFT_638154 [Hypoxylon sp. NC1633]|nr:hypothetical protein GGR54DRAFT_638154 [Hypoxylon sp. NC1633]